jgi:TonB family protein
VNWHAVGTLSALCVGFTLLADRVDAQVRACRLAVETVAAGSGAAVARAEVSIASAVALTDSAGRAFLPVESDGRHTVSVRRLGYQPYRALVSVDCAGVVSSVSAELVPLSTSLDVVTVRADAVRRYSGAMAAFWERRARGDGVFFTAAEIDRRNVQRLPDLLRTVPGWGRSSQPDVLSDALVRGTAVRMGAVSRDAMRSAPAKCFPTVVIDGMAATMSELNVDGIDPRSLSGVEVYTDGSRTPSEFWGVSGQGRCGVVAIWSRSMDNVRHTPLEQQIALADSIYSVSEVDEAARIDDAVPFQVLYPRELRRKRTAGSATVSLVVLPTGEPFLHQVSLLRSSHPEFGTALVDAVPTLRFLPARRSGQAVSQRAELTIQFELNGSAVKR